MPFSGAFNIYEVYINDLPQVSRICGTVVARISPLKRKPFCGFLGYRIFILIRRRIKSKATTTIVATPAAIRTIAPVL